MKVWPFTRRGNSPLSGLALEPQQAGRMFHHLEERLQAVEQALADQRREWEEGLRLCRRLQAQGDAHLWQKTDTLVEEVEALRVEQALLETPV